MRSHWPRSPSRRRLDSAKDRAYAFSRGKLAAADYVSPRPKTDFLMLLIDEGLAALDARFEDAGDRLSLFRRRNLLFEGSLAEAGDVARLEDFIEAYMAPFRRDKAPDKPRLLRFPGRRFTDVAGRAISIDAGGVAYQSEVRPRARASDRAAGRSAALSRQYLFRRRQRLEESTGSARR